MDPSQAGAPASAPLLYTPPAGTSMAPASMAHPVAPTAFANSEPYASSNAYAYTAAPPPGTTAPALVAQQPSPEPSFEAARAFDKTKMGRLNVHFYEKPGHAVVPLVIGVHGWGRTSAAFHSTLNAEKHGVEPHRHTAGGRYHKTAKQWGTKHIEFVAEVATPRIDPRLWAAILAEVGVAMAASNAKVRNPLSGILKLFGLLCLVVGIYAGLETIGDWNEGDSATMFAVVSGGGIIVGATALFVGAKMGQDALDSIAQGLNDACTRLQPNCNTAGLHIEPFFFRPPTSCARIVCRALTIALSEGDADIEDKHGNTPKSWLIIRPLGASWGSSAQAGGGPGAFA